MQAMRGARAEMIVAVIQQTRAGRLRDAAGGGVLSPRSPNCAVKSPRMEKAKAQVDKPSTRCADARHAPAPLSSNHAHTDEFQGQHPLAVQPSSSI